MWRRERGRGAAAVAGLGLLVACSSGITIVDGAMYNDARVTNELANIARQSRLAYYSDIADLGVWNPVDVVRRGCVPDTTGNRLRNAAGVPNSELRTYQCNAPIEGATRTIRGSERIEALGDGFAARVTWSGFKLVIVSAGGTLEVMFDGVTEIRLRDPRTLEINENVVERIISGGGAVSRLRRLVRTYTDTADILGRAFPQPATLTIAGQFSYADDAYPRDTLHLVVSTPEILRVMPRCLANGGFRSGQLSAVRANSAAAPIGVGFVC